MQWTSPSGLLIGHPTRLGVGNQGSKNLRVDLYLKDIREAVAIFTIAGFGLTVHHPRVETFIHLYSLYRFA